MDFAAGIEQQKQRAYDERRVLKRDVDRTLGALNEETGLVSVDHILGKDLKISEAAEVDDRNRVADLNNKYLVARELYCQKDDFCKQLDRDCTGTTNRKTIRGSTMGLGIDVIDAFDDACTAEAPAKLTELALLYGEGKDKIKVMKAELAAYSSEVRKMEEELYLRLTNETLDSISTEGHTYYCKLDRYATLAKDNPESGKQWVRDNGFDFLIQESVNSQSLSSALTRHLEDGGELPDESDGIRIHLVERVGKTKAAANKRRAR